MTIMIKQSNGNYTDRDYYNWHPLLKPAHIIAEHFSYNLGTAWCYLYRQGKKNGATLLDDWYKAADHIQFEVNRFNNLAISSSLSPVSRYFPEWLTYQNIIAYGIWPDSAVLGLLSIPCETRNMARIADHLQSTLGNFKGTINDLAHQEQEGRGGR